MDLSFEAGKKRREGEGVDAKEVPEGSPDCLAGLTIVFTGELDKLSREEAQDLVKKLGASV